jgi:hypothetical protein
VDIVVNHTSKSQSVRVSVIDLSSARLLRITSSTSTRKFESCRNLAVVVRVDFQLHYYKRGVNLKIFRWKLSREFAAAHPEIDCMGGEFLVCKNLWASHVTD